MSYFNINLFVIMTSNLFMLYYLSLIVPALALPSPAFPVILDSTSNISSFLTPRLILDTSPQPNFPADPPSCPLCATNYTQIAPCIGVSAVLANVSMVLFNPAAFLQVIQCACTDPFLYGFPQCVDCFQQTNQTAYLPATNASAIESGAHTLCALEGNTGPQTTSTTSGGVPVATPSSTTSSGVSASSSAEQVYRRRGGLCDALWIVAAVALVWG